MSIAIRIDKLSKRYRLGLTHAGSLRELVNGTAARLMRRPGSQPPASGRNAPAKIPTAFWALRDVECEISSGKAIGIIGRNGAGKSTLLKILSRITQPTAGRIELHGRVASLLEVGTGFHPELTGRENVFLNGTILGMTRADIRKRFDEIVQFSGVETFIDTPVKRYSSGMKVRLGFAVAAHLEPEILIVDEVLAVGDVEFQRKCLGKMDEVAGSGRTVLLVSHNMGTIRQLTNESIVLEGGQVAFSGATEKAIEVYSEAVRGGAETLSLENHRRRTEFPGRALIETIGLPETDRPLAAGETLPIQMRIRAEDYSGTIRISTTVYTMGSSAIGSAFSEQTVELKCGEITLVEMGLNTAILAPGSYCLGISIGTGNTATGIRNFDSLADVLPFEVAHDTVGEGVLATWRRGWGAIRFPSPKIMSHRIEDRSASV